MTVVSRGRNGRPITYDPTFCYVAGEHHTPIKGGRGEEGTCFFCARMLRRIDRQWHALGGPLI